MPGGRTVRPAFTTTLAAALQAGKTGGKPQAAGTSAMTGTGTGLKAGQVADDPVLVLLTSAVQVLSAPREAVWPTSCAVGAFSVPFATNDP